MEKSHVPWHATADMVFMTMNYYLPNIYRKYEEYVKQLYEWQTHQKHKKKQ